MLPGPWHNNYLIWKYLIFFSNDQKKFEQLINNLPEPEIEQVPEPNPNQPNNLANPDPTDGLNLTECEVEFFD